MQTVHYWSALWVWPGSASGTRDGEGTETNIDKTKSGKNINKTEKKKNTNDTTTKAAGK